MSTKTKQTIYYKIVKVDLETNKLYSFCVNHNLRIEYIPNKFVKSKCISKLCCFKSEESARNFLSIQCCGCYGVFQYQIWQCKIGTIYENSYIPFYNSPYQLYLRINLIETLIRKNKKFTHLVHKGNLVFPHGTIFTDKIMLTKKLPFYPLSDI